MGSRAHFAEDVAHLPSQNPLPFAEPSYGITPDQTPKSAGSRKAREKASAPKIARKMAEFARYMKAKVRKVLILWELPGTDSIDTVLDTVTQAR